MSIRCFARRLCVALACSACSLSASAGTPVASTFTYQGRVALNGVAVSGTMDVLFTLWDAQENGLQVGGSFHLGTVSVIGGVFSAEVDFGVEAFNGEERWLQIAVRPAGSIDAYTEILPRHALRVAPYALQTRGIFVDSARNVFVNGDISLNSTGTGRFIGMVPKNGPGSDLTVRAGGSASAHGAGVHGGNLILRAGNANLSCTASPPTGTSAGNDLMLFAGENVFNGACSSLWNGNIRFFAGNNQPERMRLVGDNGFLGIGTANPSSLLDVAGNAKLGSVEVTGTATVQSGTLTVGSGSSTGGGISVYGGTVIGGPAYFESSSDVGSWIRLNNTTLGANQWCLVSTGSANGEGAGNLLFRNQTQFANRLVLHANGRVGINTNAPGATLHVNGDLKVSSVPFADRGNAQYDPVDQKFYYDNSSRRYKKNITRLDDDFERLLNLEPKTYTRPIDPSRWEIGLIAEEVDAAGLNRLVNYDPEGRPDGVNYAKVPLYLIQIAKQQRREIEELRAEKDAEVESLRRQNAALEARLGKLAEAIRAQR